MPAICKVTEGLAAAPCPTSTPDWMLATLLPAAQSGSCPQPPPRTAACAPPMFVQPQPSESLTGPDKVRSLTRPCRTAPAAGRRGDRRWPISLHIVHGALPAVTAAI